MANIVRIKMVTTASDSPVKFVAWYDTGAIRKINPGGRVPMTWVRFVASAKNRDTMVTASKKVHRFWN